MLKFIPRLTLTLHLFLLVLVSSTCLTWAATLQEQGFDFGCIQNQSPQMCVRTGPSSIYSASESAPLFKLQKLMNELRTDYLTEANNNQARLDEIISLTRTIFSTYRSIPGSIFNQADETEYTTQFSSQIIAANRESIQQNPILALNFAKVISIVLLEPENEINFFSILNGAGFGDGAKDFPAESNLSNTIAGAGIESAHCTPLANLCSDNRQCLKFNNGIEGGTNAIGVVCSSNSECSSGYCNKKGSSGFCEEDYRCQACIAEGGTITSGSNLTCCSGTSAHPSNENNGDQVCIAEPFVGAGVSMPDIVFKPLDQSSCAPILQDSLRNTVLGVYTANDRVLNAFEYIFLKTNYDGLNKEEGIYGDNNGQFGQLGRMKAAAETFANARISSKKAYEQTLNSIIQIYDEQLRQQEGAAIGDSDALGAAYYEYFKQKEEAQLQLERSRIESFPQVKTRLDEFITKTNQINWGKDGSFGKKNKCGKWHIVSTGPSIWGNDDNEDCFNRKWNLSGGGSFNSAFEFIQAFSFTTFDDEGGINSNKKPVGKAQPLESLPSGCITNPPLAGRAGLPPNGFVSLPALKGAIGNELTAYAAEPIGNGSSNSDISIPDATFNLEPDDNGNDPKKELIETAARSAVAFGLAPSCKNSSSSQAKKAYAMAIKKVIDDMIKFYRAYADFREVYVIPCLENRIKALQEMQCEEGALDCQENQECSPISPDFPGCLAGDTVCSTTFPDQDPDCLSADGICDENVENDPDCLPDGICSTGDSSDPDCVNAGCVSGSEGFPECLSTLSNNIEIQGTNGFDVNGGVISGLTGDGLINNGTSGTSGGISSEFNASGTGQGAFNRKNSGDTSTQTSATSGGSTGRDGSGRSIGGSGAGNGTSGSVANTGTGSASSRSGNSAENNESSNKDDDENKNQVVLVGGKATGAAKTVKSITKYDPFQGVAGQDYTIAGNPNVSVPKESKLGEDILKEQNSIRNKAKPGDDIFTRVTKTYRRQAFHRFLIRKPASEIGTVEFKEAKPDIKKTNSILEGLK